MRGVVELEILRLLERAMGSNLRIQYFFDLIVGTRSVFHLLRSSVVLTINSTGGLIALGLAAKGWTVEECISHFERLCEKAFTRRAGANIPLVRWVVDNYNHSKYETGPLEDSLMGSYSEDQYLFGGRRPLSAGIPSVQVNIKVAVTTTNAATGNTVLLTNYNRASTHVGRFDLFRSIFRMETFAD